MTALRQKRQKIVELTILTAIVVLLQLVGNTIHIGEYSISLILLPIVLGAVQCGPGGGAWLGIVFGAVLVLTGETDAYLAISHFLTILSVLLRGAGTGFLSGIIYKKAAKRNRDLAIILTSIAVPLLNSSLFIILLLICFYDFLASAMGSGNVLSGLLSAVVSINFLIELAGNMVLAPILIRLADLPEKRIPEHTAAERRIGMRLATRLIIAVILLGVIICIVSAGSSFRSFRASLEKQYDDDYQIEDMESTMRRSITASIVTTVCIEVIFITLYYYYISYMLIKPIGSISNEVSRFIESDNSPCTSIQGINTRDEIRLLAEDIVKMEQDIGIYIDHIRTVTAEQERIVTELSIATKIQADMLPNTFPAFPDRKEFDIFASMKPARKVGGDFYDFFMPDDDHLALVIADVSDKGVPAALFMVVTKTLLKNQATFTLSPKQILETVNNQLCENNKSRMFVTVWICIFEISTGRCVAANAGHEYPAIRKNGGAFELIEDEHGFVLGGIRDSRYEEYEFLLEKGDTLFVYTDGVTEAADSEEEIFETDRMLEALNRNGEAAPSGLIGNVTAAISDFVGEAEQFDDITMLCIKRT